MLRAFKSVAQCYDRVGGGDSVSLPKRQQKLMVRDWVVTEMTQRYHVIVNPNASSVEQVDSIEDVLSPLGDYRLYETSAAGDASRIAAELSEAGDGVVVVAGGDGTLSEVINGLAPDFRVPVGLIPLGTGNDFARSLAMDEDPKKAALQLTGSGSVAADVIRLQTSRGTHYFLNTSAGGFTTVVDSKLTDESKSFWGALAYYVSAARALPELSTYALDLTVDGAESLQVNAYAVIVANGEFIAGGIPIAPGARWNDGLADVLIVPEMPLPSLAVALAQILRGEHSDNQDLIFRRVRRLRIDSGPEPCFEVNGDGELCGSVPIEYTVLPGAVDIIGAAAG